MVYWHSNRWQKKANDNGSLDYILYHGHCSEQFAFWKSGYQSYLVIMSSVKIL